VGNFFTSGISFHLLKEAAVPGRVVCIQILLPCELPVSANRTENTQRYKIYSTFLPGCIVTTTGSVMCKYFVTVPVCCSDFHCQPFIVLMHD